MVQWLNPGTTRANDYEQAELGKTEISLMHFSVSCHIDVYLQCTVYIHTYTPSVSIINIHLTAVFTEVHVHVDIP